MILSLHTSPFPVAKVISSFCPLLYSPLRSNVATIAPTLTTRCSGITSEFPKLQSHSRQLKPDIDKQQHPLAESNRDVDDAAPANGKGYDDGIISGVQVPRSRYICVSKSELLNAIVTTMFESEAEADLFIQLSKGLDSILHAEHKCFLEEMRVNYDLTHSAGSFGRMGLSSDLEREYAEKKKEFEDFFRKSVEFLSKKGYEGDMPERGNSSIRPDLQSQSDISGKSSFKLSRCSYSKTLWDNIRGWLGIHRQMSSLWAAYKWLRKESRGSRGRNRVRKMAVAAVCYYIWLTRNRKVMEGTLVPLATVEKEIKTHLYFVLNFHSPVPLTCI